MVLLVVGDRQTGSSLRCQISWNGWVFQVLFCILGWLPSSRWCDDSLTPFLYLSQELGKALLCYSVTPFWEVNNQLHRIDCHGFFGCFCLTLEDPVLWIGQEKFLGSTSKINNPLDMLSRIHLLRDTHLWPSFYCVILIFLLLWCWWPAFQDGGLLPHSLFHGWIYLPLVLLPMFSSTSWVDEPFRPTT